MIYYQPDGDALRQRLFRGLLYGAPFLAAALMLATGELLAEFFDKPVPTWVPGCAFALVAAFGSAAGAFGLRNRLAWRVAHAISAAVVAVAVYAVAVAAFFAVTSE
jgi:hypothetical protein